MGEREKTDEKKPIKLKKRTVISHYLLGIFQCRFVATCGLFFFIMHLYCFNCTVSYLCNVYLTCAVIFGLEINMLLLLFCFPRLKGQFIYTSDR